MHIAPKLTHKNSTTLISYNPAWNWMKNYTQRRTAHSNDYIWTLEHQPVYTLGQAANQEQTDLINTIPVIRSDRGGQITYHGPGQLIIYLLFGTFSVSFIGFCDHLFFIITRT